MATVNTVSVLLLLLCQVTGNDVMDRAAAAAATTPDPAALAHLTALVDQLSNNISHLSAPMSALSSRAG